MSTGVGREPVAILAGRGAIPPIVAAAAARQGRAPVVFAIVGEADPAAFGSLPVHPVRFGELGRLFRLVHETGCKEAVFIGAVVRRPDLKSIRPDFGMLKLLPRALQLLRTGDDTMLSGVASFFGENGLKLISALDLAPELALPEGHLVGQPTSDTLASIAKASEAARLIGELDIGQGAVAVGGRVVTLEDAAGTDAMLERVTALRESGRIPRTGGVLVKCVKPNQDRRFDLPTIGPGTAEKAREAGLEGVAAEAGETLLAGRSETIEAFRRSGLFLLGLTTPAKQSDG